MKFAVIGSGGVGAYFGGRLAQAGHDVTFVARGAHLAAIQLRGLKVLSPEGDFEVSPARVTDDPSVIDPVDVAILAVKTWQVEDVAALLPRLLGPGGAVLTLQNGVEAPDQVASACGRDRVLAGVCRIMSFVAEPGVVRHAGVKPSIGFGWPSSSDFQSRSDAASSGRRRRRFSGSLPTMIPSLHAAAYTIGTACPSDSTRRSEVG